jgi:hypothetical protein
MENSTVSNNRNIALLIDGDNAQPSLLGRVLTEAGRYGSMTIRRIYGDWTTSNMNGWKEVLNHHAVQPVQQFRYTVGKNATDSAMIIDAMDILHTGRVDGFCLVSSDSDYTRLATRIREAGIFVMGVGAQKTPKPFVNACNLFIYTENLQPPKEISSKSRRSRGGRVSKTEEKPERKQAPLSLLREAFDMSVQEDGWAKLDQVGFNLRQLDPAFDPRTYGHKQLSQMFKNLTEQFETRIEGETGRSHIWVRSKE